jgi:beta-galactosidase
MISIHSLAADETNSPREKLLMDFGWKFHLGNDWGTGEELINLGISTGPAKPNFNDSSWTSLDLPHDWAVALPFDRNANGNEGYKPRGPGYPQNSIAWYRRTFTLPKEDLGKRLWLEFGGIYRDSLIYLNGCLIGRQQRGYNSFRYDITDVANYGGKNVLAVRVDASQFEGWFYEGAGIYRHVWLEKTAPVAIVPDGVFVYSQLTNYHGAEVAGIVVQTKILNSESNDCVTVIYHDLFDPNGNLISKVDSKPEGNEPITKLKLNPYSQFEHEIGFILGIPPGVPATWVAGDLNFYVAPNGMMPCTNAPILWSPENPKLYKLVTTVEVDSNIVDRVETEFGIRTLAFDPDKGFLLNGQPYFVKGTCDHQDAAGVGWALPDALQYFRVAKLKEMGDNAIRTTHNEPTEELLEACDRLGMLVMDESRTVGSDADNLGQLEFQIRRDRNHPSVFIWSIGNEEPIQNSSIAKRVAVTMQNLIHRLDPSREVTYAASVGNQFTGMNSVTDVRGWNYHIDAIDAYHQAHPTQPEIGTEQASIMTTRGIYARDPAHGYQSAYDDKENRRNGNNTAEEWWTFFAARPWLSGGFAWAGFDYRGETAPYGWPCISSHYGVLDTCGFPKDTFYYYQSWWTTNTVLHLLPHWNWPGKEGTNIDVRCFSNCKEVELFLNGQSLGRKNMPENSHLQWLVPYTPGILSAKGYQDGKVIAETKVETTGEPAAIQLTADRSTINADGEDCSVVTVAVRDAQGRIVPVAGNLINFEILGAGKIIGVGNGDPSSHEADVCTTPTAKRSVFNGLAQVIVQANKDAGDIQLTAQADGLTATTLTIHAAAHPPHAALP